MANTIIDLIRHGEPVGGRKYRGQVDDPLSGKGWQQMWQAVGEFDQWQGIVTSPLSRCSEFAQALAEKRQIPVRQDERLQEVGFGVWEGKAPDELLRLDPGILSRFKRDPVGNRPQGAEPLDAFFARVSTGWRDMLHLHQGQHVLVVCHAGVIRMVLAEVLGIPPQNAYRIQVASAAISRITVEGQGEEAFASLLFHHGSLFSSTGSAE